MKLSRIYTTIILMGLTISAWGQSAGTTGFEFLKAQYSARGAALANNMVAIQGDINAIFYNPAVLSAIQNSQWTINYTDHLLDFQAGQLVYGLKSNKLGTLAFGLLYFNYGDFQETDQFGDFTGRDFSATEFALATSSSNNLGEGFQYGLNVKFIYSSLDNFNASGLAFDGGIIYAPSGISDFNIGISLSNLGFILSDYTPTADEKMPLYLRFGLSKRLEHLPLTLLASLNDITLKTESNSDILKRFSIGGEFDISTAVKLRLGYDNGVNQSVKVTGERSFSGFSAGLGIHWKKLRLDYAYSTYGDLGAQNRLGISGGF